MVISDDNISRWPDGIRVLALAFEVDQARAWAEHFRQSNREYHQRQVANRLQDVRRLLISLRQHSSNVMVAAADVFVESLTEHSDRPPEGQWPESEQLLRVLSEELHTGMQPAPADGRDWKRRTGLLAKRSWIGGHAGSCPAGWVPLLERAVSQAERWVSRAALDQCQTSQIKEKFGTLRWYLRSNELLSVIVDFAELASTVTCLVCGAKGELRSDRDWLLTLCDRHDELDRGSGSIALSRLAYPSAPE